MEGNITYIIVFLVALLVMFYFFIIRPQRRRQREHEELTSRLEKGDSVITTGGIYGQIESANQNSVVLRVESGATIRVAKASIASKA